MNLLIYVQAFFMLFIVFDPIGIIPMFQAFTAGFSEEERSKIAKQSTLVAAAILLFFAFLGNIILNYLGVSVNDFMIAAGVVLFIFSLDLIMGSLEPKTRKIETESLAYVPLATPLLAGPGSISTVMYLMYEPFGLLPTLFSITLNSLIAYLLLKHSSFIFKVLGKNGTKAVTRVMGLLTAALAVSFIRRGIGF